MTQPELQEILHIRCGLTKHRSEWVAKILMPIIEVTGGTSDGYHTFDELYEHRMALTLGLMKNCPKISWRSRNHHPDGEIGVNHGAYTPKKFKD